MMINSVISNNSIINDPILAHTIIGIGKYINQKTA